MLNATSLLNRFGHWLASNLVQMSLELTILAMVVLAAIYLLRIKSPRLRHLFWCLVLAKPVTTLLIASPLSFYQFVMPEAVIAPPAAPVAIMETAPTGRLQGRHSMSGRRRYGAAPTVPQIPVPAWQHLDRYGVGSLAWIVIASAFGARLLMGYAYVAFLRQTAKPQREGPLAELVRTGAAALRMQRTVTVATTNVAHGPVLAGVLRPVILLPESVAGALATPQLQLIVTHELAHARRWDNLVLLLQRLAEMFLFFHPVVWICGWVMRREAEAACDDAVVAAYGDSAAYADSLTRVAEMKCGITRRLLVNTFAAAESNFSRRVRRILRGRPGRRTLWVTAASAVALVAVAAVGLPTAKNKEAKPDEAVPNGSREGMTMDATTKREGGKVWIEGVPAIETRGGWDRQLRGMQAVLGQQGVEATLDELMVLSGDAFGLCHAPQWLSGWSHLLIPTDTLTNVAQAYGYDGRWLMAARFYDLKQSGVEQSRAKTNAVLDTLWQEIDAGRPVMAGGCLGVCGNWFVVSGYDRSAAQMMYNGAWNGIGGVNVDTCGDPEVGKLGFWDGQVRGAVEPGFIGGWQGSPAFVLGAKSQAPPAEQRILNALKRGVELFHAAPYTHWDGPVYALGERAYQEWARELRALDYPADAAPERGNPPNTYSLINLSLQVEWIVRGRAAAAQFCEREANTLTHGGTHLRAAAASLGQEVALAKATFAPFIAYSPDLTPEQVAWLSDEAQREAGADAIENMLAHERAAIAEIELALEAEGIEIGAVDEMDRTDERRSGMTANVKREGGKVWIEGVPPGHGDSNSYARGLEIVLSHVGAQADYDTIMGDTGMAFITQAEDGGPLIDGAVDVGWWPLGSWGVRMRLDFLGRVVGREILQGPPSDIESFRADPAQYYRERLAPLVRASIDAGKPVMGERAPCQIVSGYDSGEPPIFGACALDPEGNVGRLEEYPWDLILLGDATAKMAREQADLEALQHAVALWRDTPQATVPAFWFQWDTIRGRTTGRKSFALWEKALRDTEYLGEARWHANMCLHLGINRRSAVAYLRTVAARHPDVAARLNAAADHYERELAELVKADCSPEAMESEDGRERLARLTGKLAEIEAQAIAEIEKALEAEGSESSMAFQAMNHGQDARATSIAKMTANIKHEGGKVWIDSVEGFSSSEWASSPHGCQARILQTLGEALSYDDLVCYSAFAFRVEWHEEMCPSAGHPYCGFACMDGSIRALPWKTQVFESMPWSKPKDDRVAFEAGACAAIKASIDRGIPVHYGGEEDGLIIGYADEGRRWWCVHPYHKNGGEAFWHDEAEGFAGGKWPWGISVWTEPIPDDERATDRDLTIVALKQAVEMWNAEKREAYFVGEAAYAHWLGWLRDVESGRIDDPKVGMQGNGWCFDVLIHSRRIAGRWLKQNADGFDDETAKHLRSAAERYAQIAELCVKDLNTSWDLALAPDRVGEWTSELRREQIARLEAAREHDRAAIAEIEAALEAEVKEL